MEAWGISHAGWITQFLLVMAFLGAAVWETFRPRQVLSLPAARRWLLHGFLHFLSSAVVLLVFGLSAVVVASSAAHNPYGLLNRASIPFAVRCLLAVLLIDFVQYADHYLRHAVPLLWRFHKVHHSDPDFDFSTGLRFHPGEALISQGIYLLAIAAAAPPASVVLCFEACNIVQVFFSHANISLPPRLERALRVIQVTPDLHRIHHSRDAGAQRSNLGVMFSFWDRLFQTYRAGSRSYEELPFGLEDVTKEQSLRLWALLALPFRSAPPTRAATFQPAAPTQR